MNKELLNAVLRTDFKSFVIKVFNDVAAGSEYLDNWHIDVICDALMNMYDGENNRLIINIPPRYMKSIICSVALPAWLLGHNPKTNIDTLYKIPEYGFSKKYLENDEYYYQYDFKYQQIDTVDNTTGEVIDSIGLSAQDFLENPDYWVETVDEDNQAEFEGILDEFSDYI